MLCLALITIINGTISPAISSATLSLNTIIYINKFSYNRNIGDSIAISGSIDSVSGSVDPCKFTSSIINIIPKYPTSIFLSIKLFHH